MVSIKEKELYIKEIMFKVKNVDLGHFIMPMVQ